MDKSYLMEMKLSELKTDSQKEVFFRYLSIAEHYISTENEKEAKEILKNLGFDKKTINSFIKTVQNHVASEFQDMKENYDGQGSKKVIKLMLIFNYKSKKELKENIGKPLNYTETSMFGPEYRHSGVLVGSNRPYSTENKGREFFAEVTIKNNIIVKVN